MTVDEICMLMEELGYRARLSSPLENVCVITSGHSGIYFELHAVKGQDSEFYSMIGFYAYLDDNDFEDLNEMNRLTSISKVCRDEDGINVKFSIFCPDRHMNKDLFLLNFAAWTSDLSEVSRYIGR